jgi:hypothetical protein
MSFEEILEVGKNFNKENIYIQKAESNIIWLDVEENEEGKT